MTINDKGEVDTTMAPGAVTASHRAPAMFAVLFAMYLLDYMDRNILYSVLKQVKSDLQISDAKAGALATYFLVSYTLISPVMGWLGDRWRRTWLLSLGVGIWSLATIGTGLAHDYGQLVLARCFLGIGEASYAHLQHHNVASSAVART
jgi:MFS family permease